MPIFQGEGKQSKPSLTRSAPFQMEEQRLDTNIHYPHHETNAFLPLKHQSYLSEEILGTSGVC
ncbi:hypothetical protein ACQP3F_32055, partial [Escherichia coli]